MEPWECYGVTFNINDKLLKEIFLVLILVTNLILALHIGEKDFVFKRMTDRDRVLRGHTIYILILLKNPRGKKKISFLGCLTKLTYGKHES